MSREVDRKHNQYRLEENAKDALKRITARIEKLHEEKDAIAEDIRESFAELKSLGFDSAATRKLVAERRKRAKDPSKYDEVQDMFDLYVNVIGLGD